MIVRYQAKHPSPKLGTRYKLQQPLLQTEESVRQYLESQGRPLEDWSLYFERKEFPRRSA